MHRLIKLDLWLAGIVLSVQEEAAQRLYKAQNLCDTKRNDPLVAVEQPVVVLL